MELADEKTMPLAASLSRSAASLNRALTPVWQSSKLPRTATTRVLAPSVVAICRRWISLTPPWG